MKKIRRTTSQRHKRDRVPFMLRQTVTKALLTRRWGQYAAQALCGGGYIDRIERKLPASYKVTKVFPSEVHVFVKEYFSVDAVSAIEGAYADVESLKEELEEWYNNLPESFQNGDKGEQLQSAISELEDIQMPDLDGEELNKLPKVVVWPSGSSRADRAGSAADILEAASEAIEGRITALGGRDTVDVVNAVNAEVVDALRALEGDFSDHANTLRSVSFPGMY